jgi:hypothetical protein
MVLPVELPFFCQIFGGCNHLFQVDGAKGSFRSDRSNYLGQMIMYLVPPQLRTRFIPSSCSRHRLVDLSCGSVAYPI